MSVPFWVIEAEPSQITNSKHNFIPCAQRTCPYKSSKSGGAVPKFDPPTPTTVAHTHIIIVMGHFSRSTLGLSIHFHVICTFPPKPFTSHELPNGLPLNWRAACNPWPVFSFTCC